VLKEDHNMVERKSALRRAPARPELDRLIEKAKVHTMTDEELRAQRASFVYGNAPEGSRITKESAMASVNSLRVCKETA